MEYEDRWSRPVRSVRSPFLILLVDLIDLTFVMYFKEMYL